MVTGRLQPPLDVLQPVLDAVELAAAISAPMKPTASTGRVPTGSHRLLAPVAGVPPDLAVTVS
jgi:hypothetical protein